MKLPWPILTLGAAGASLVIHAFPGAAELLQFSRTGIGAGEIWGMVSGHFTHFDFNHLAWDVGALLVLGCICEAQSRKRMVAALALAAVTISAAVWLWQPQFAFYRGLSGLDSALFGLFAGSLLWRQDVMLRLVGAVALLGFTAKCGFEIALRSPLFADGASYAPVPLAHAIGLAAGLLAALLPRPTTSAVSRAALPPCPPRPAPPPALPAGR